MRRDADIGKLPHDNELEADLERSMNMGCAISVVLKIMGPFWYSLYSGT